MFDLKTIQLQDDMCARCGGNKFAAASYSSKIAKHHLKETENRIFDSEAIQWAVTGERPAILDHIERAEPLKHAVSRRKVEDVISDIYDEDVRLGVQYSIRESYRAQALVYVYACSDEEKCSRVRVITNMIWNDFPSESEK